MSEQSPERAIEFSLGEWHEQAPGVYTLVAEPESVNVVLVVGEKGCAIVDPGSSPAQGAELRARIAEVTDLPLKAAIVTHEHYDHWFGLKAYADLPCYGHRSLLDAIDSPATLAAAEKLGLTREDLHAPTKPLSALAAIDLGGRRCEIVHVGSAHTASDCVVVVPESQVLIAGDIVESLPAEKPSLSIEPDSDVDGWIQALNMLGSLTRGEATVIPGHGPAVDKAFAFDQTGKLSEAAFEAERLAREGVPLAEAEQKGDWPFEYARLQPAVEKTYRRLGAVDGVRKNLPLA